MLEAKGDQNAERRHSWYSHNRENLQTHVRARKVRITCRNGDTAAPCPIKWLDSFAMRNFTNDAIFDDTLPAADGLMEIGNRVPLERLQSAMEDWFRRKGYLKPAEGLECVEVLSMRRAEAQQQPQ